MYNRTYYSSYPYGYGRSYYSSYNSRIIPGAGGFLLPFGIGLLSAPLFYRPRPNYYYYPNYPNQYYYNQYYYY